MTDTQNGQGSPNALGPGRFLHPWVTEAAPRAKSCDAGRVSQLRPGAGRRRPPVAGAGPTRARWLHPDNRRVLIVDDDEGIHDDFTEILLPRAARGNDDLATAFVGREERQDDFLPDFELLHACSGEQAYEMVRRGRESGRPVAAAFVDIGMPPGMNGVDTLRRMRAVDAEVEIVLMTAYTDKSLSAIVGDMELLHKLLYLRKPFAREEIQQITLSLVEKWNVARELAEKQRQLVSSHGWLATVLDAAGDAIAMYDVSERLVFANRSYEDLVGASEAELREMGPQEVAAYVRQRLRELRLDDAGRGFFIVVVDGAVEPVGVQTMPEQRLFQRSQTPVRDERRSVIGDLYAYRDVSAAIEAERMKAEVVRLRGELVTADG